MPETPRMLGNYTIEQSIYIGDKEVIFGTDHREAYPFMVCHCDYNNPLSAPWPSDAVASDDYLEAMSIFNDRVRDQIERMQSELSRFQFDMTPFTRDDCIPDDRLSNLIGKVLVINVEDKRYEFQYSAYQLVLAGGGNGASGGRGSAVFGTNLATRERGRRERFDVIGELTPSRMPEWAKASLAFVGRNNRNHQGRPDKMTTRTNAGFQIIDSIFIGESEFVLGVNKATPAMYVTWKCTDGTDYYLGHYHTDQIAAKKDLLKRAQEELDSIEQHRKKVTEDNTRSR